MSSTLTPTLPISTRRPTLLIVDDEEGPRQSIRFVFKDEYNILIADNGVRAIELARSGEVDSVVLDIRMSGMSGIEVLRQLKEINPTIEVVMLTAYETLETARQALRLGACDYLNKPFDIATLRHAVNSAMERHVLARQMQDNTQRLKQVQDDIQTQQLREELARTRGDIYASIIHDINGPLTVISGFIETINQRIGSAQLLEGEKLDIIKDRLARVTKSVTNCVQISRRYLSFLQGGAAASSLVSVNQILSDLEELLRAHPEAPDSQLAITPLAQDTAAAINGTDLIQILLNLTINAFQNSPKPGRVLVHAETLERPIDFANLEQGPGSMALNRDGFQNVPPIVAISVEDHGPGIPPESLSRIFEPYFTARQSGQGSGLGLAIVRRLVEQAKGLIAVRSEVGRGSTFTIFFPARRIDSTAASAAL